MGLDDGGGGSSSSSSTSNETISADNRVAGADNGVTLGTNAAVQVTQEFPDSVAQQFQNLINLGQQAGAAIVQVANNAVSAQSQALDTFAQLAHDQAQLAGQTTQTSLTALQQNAQGTNTSPIATDYFPYIVVGILGLIAVFIILNRRK